ncbi:MAG TPA: leucyl/phenylalanyl-tRNA--protein transferase [Miltoncostaeaceae bacterium]|nr:leucyl/phenylalanyl-tRNA--protein transferase [Miltoncostaeaceae bacterium]
MDHPSLAPDALLAAYAEGGFPMDEAGARGAVGLYTCDPRGVMPIEGFRVPRSVARALRARPYAIRVDAAFAEVAEACSGARSGGMWLTPRLVAAYVRLHRAGWAHSVEAWDGPRLAGGLFGVALGGLFTSETMFHRAPDAGNAALVGAARLLADAGFALWDIQMTSSHTRRFGAVGIPADAYLRRLAVALAVRPRPLGAPAS